MQYEIQPGVIHAAIVDIAADGQALLAAGTDAGTSADQLAGSFGSAEVVAGAFSRFWEPRRDVARNISSLVFRKTTALADAAAAFVEADGQMSAAAQSALTKLPTEYSPVSPPQTGRLRFLEQ
ncbi:hypothetical protein ITX31_05780 [Arthrobacter gandavensis]|uniref:DUF6507 family protein n=1 Tax=Arthrobacter gandavensis TaxID=169960 RepID=UPI0018905F8F|nr:DUF6507 family protein [Arthrobacter gandavensis]MBF4993618.1 hypothetical protein [Arthrobacter gandavensis]